MKKRNNSENDIYFISLSSPFLSQEIETAAPEKELCRQCFTAFKDYDRDAMQELGSCRVFSPLKHKPSDLKKMKKVKTYNSARSEYSK